MSGVRWADVVERPRRAPGPTWGDTALVAVAVAGCVAFAGYVAVLRERSVANERVCAERVAEATRRAPLILAGDRPGRASACDRLRDYAPELVP